jgi:hypothetical protein
MYLCSIALPDVCRTVVCVADRVMYVYRKYIAKKNLRS